MKISRAYITVVVVFIAGFILGGATLPLLLMHSPFLGHRPPADAKYMLLKRLADDLDLDDNQVAQVRPFVFELDQQLNNLREETDPKIKAIIQASVFKVEPFLSAAQKEELHKIASRFPPSPPKQ